MMELMDKLNEVSREIFEVVPRKRLQKLINKVVTKPIQRAMKKMGKPDEDGFIQEEIDNFIDDFLDEFTPEALSMALMTSLLQSNQIEKLKEFSECMEMSEEGIDVKEMTEKIVSIIEKHAVAIGRIVERTIILGYEIKADLDEENEQ